MTDATVHGQAVLLLINDAPTWEKPARSRLACRTARGGRMPEPSANSHMLW